MSQRLAISSRSDMDERFLALALCGEAGELANMIKKRWRDGADLSDEIRDEIGYCLTFIPSTMPKPWAWSYMNSV